jgi:4-alpha-glucanotransferase
MAALGMRTCSVLAQRASGVLLPLSALPGAHGCGDLGANAYHFVDWLVSAGQRLWHMPPLSPVGSGHSPRHRTASLAGILLQVDLDELVARGWLSARAHDGFESAQCDFDRVTPYRLQSLEEAWRGFLNTVQKSEWEEFERFCAQQALQAVVLDMANDLDFYSFVQWRSSVQWRRLQDYACAHGVSIVGGEPTQPVAALRGNCGPEGMRVLQFAFGDTSENSNLPHNYAAETVACTGTQDSNTVVGWWRSASASEQHAARCYLGTLADTEIHWAMMLAQSQSPARTVVFPLQDVLGLDESHRMTTADGSRGCWRWRFQWHQMQEAPTRRLAEMVGAHGRRPPVPH